MNLFRYWAIVAIITPPAVAAEPTGPNPVEFKSGGEKVVGTLYLPAAYTPGQKLPAVVVAGPFLNTKEMVPANYAKALAARGFAALAFDFRYWGGSGGEPRFYESASAKVADIRAAVAHLKGRAEIDAQRIGAVGVCFGAGHVIAAAVEDADIRAVVTVAAWIHDPASVEAAFGKEEVARRYKAGRAAMDTFKTSGAVDTVPAESSTDKEAAMQKVDYYSDTARGAGVKSFANRMAVMSWPEWLDFDAVKLAPKLKTPLLLIHSDGSALPDNVKTFHAKAAGPKELYWAQGNHTDFYDKPAFVGKAADAAAAHFRRTFGLTDAAAGVKEFFAALEAMDVERFLKVWAEDGVQEMPFAPGDFPKKLDGKASIRKQYEPLPKAFAGMKFPIRRLLPTADPRVVLAEYDGSIALKAGGRYDNRYIGVFTFDAAGKLKHFTEYFDPFTLLRGFPGAAAVGAPADEQVAAVLKRLPAAADGRDWKGVRAVFADEVDVDYTSVAGGKPGVTKADDLVKGWADGLGKFKTTKHNFSDVVVKLDGSDAATATFTGIATHEKADGKRWTCGGDYTYRLKRTPDGWRVTAAKFDMKWEQGDR